MSYSCPLYRPPSGTLRRQRVDFQKKLGISADKSWQGVCIEPEKELQEDNMRKQFFIPMMVGILALGATQVFAQSATVVMRNGDRVRADVVDMGANFTF